MILRRNLLFLLLSIATIMLISGCASIPHNTGYLQNYNAMTKGTYIDKVWFNVYLIDRKKYSTIYIEPVNANKIPNTQDITAEDCKSWLDKALRQYSSTIRQHITFDKSGADAYLKAVIVEIDPGSAAGRMFAGELGLGHAWVQVEGKITDPNSNEVIFSFTDRRRDSGLIGLEDLAGDQGANFVKRMLEQIAESLFKEIKEVFEF